MNNTFNFAKELIEKASKLILKNYKNIRTISYKKSFANLVTNVDHEVEELILRKITSRYPEHSIIAEESGKKIKNPKYKWFIDPIDGTTNFAHGYPFFCISVGFAINDILQFGLVKNPITNEFYSARKGKGAKLNGKPISVSKVKKIKESLLVTGFSHDGVSSKQENFKNFQTLTTKSHGVRRDGAAALDLCYVACGRVDAFWEKELNPWDVASGVLILKEALGKITGLKGNKYSIYDKNILASNGFIHNELLKYLR